MASLSKTCWRRHRGPADEGMLGALAKRAAVVAAAMRRTGGLDDRGITQAPSTPEPRNLSLDSQNLFSDVADSPGQLIGPDSPQPSAVAPPAAKAKAPAGPFAPLNVAAPTPAALVTRGYGSSGDMPFAELLASGGTDPAQKSAPTAKPLGLGAQPATGKGTELMGGAPKPLAVVPTLESQSGAPAASKNVATILMPDLLARAAEREPTSRSRARAYRRRSEMRKRRRHLPGSTDRTSCPRSTSACRLPSRSRTANPRGPPRRDSRPLPARPAWTSTLAGRAAP
jgi:hypothetical protein